MKRIVSKATPGKKSGKKVRVATTFTGVTALATAFTPALAAAAHASSLRVESCAGRPTWLHIRGERGTVHSQCWGFRGGLDINPGSDFESSWCGGNNFGFINWYGIAAGGTGEKMVDYHQGTTFALPGPRGTYSNVVGVHISGWKGSDKC